jgi:hypothetical protein
VNLPSASKLELAELCIASTVYAGFTTVSEASERGIIKHSFHYDVLELGREEALKRVPEQHLDMCRRFNTEALPAGQRGAWAGEVAFALNIETGKARELGRNIGRDYTKAGATPFDLCGTIDILGMTPDRGAVICVDLKTGWTRVTRATKNLQLLFAAVCASKVYGVDAALGAILYADEDGDPFWDSTKIPWDAVDLAAAEERIITIGRAAHEAQRLFHDGDPETGEVKNPRMVAGPHCKYCDAINTCPAQGALVRRFIALPDETENDFRKGLSENDVASHAFRRLIAAKAAVEKALGIVYARAARSPIALGNGKVLGTVSVEREYLDAAKVHEVANALYGPTAASIAIDMKASKASIERMARELREIGGGSIVERKRAVLDEVRARGGARVKVSSTVAEHEVEPPALPAGETK